MGTSHYQTDEYDALWEKTAFAYDFENEPDETELRLTRQQLLALAWIGNTRAEVTKKMLSLFITIDGRHRSGKSLLGCELADLWDASFWENREHRIIQTPEQLLEEIEIIDRQKINCPAIIVDEAGVSLSSKDWFQRIMKAVSKTANIIGYLHPIIIFIAPNQDEILSTLRKMSHIYIKVRRFNNACSTFTPYNVEYNTMRKKYFFKHPRISLFGQPIELRRIQVSLPPKYIKEGYEQIEQARKPLLLRDIRDDARKSEVKAQREVFDAEKTVDFVCKNFNYFKSVKSKPDKMLVDSKKLRHQFRLKQKDADDLKIEVENKLNRIALEIQEGIKQ